MSASFLKDSPAEASPPEAAPHSHFAPAARFSDSAVYQASAPDFANSSTTLRFTAGSFSGLLQAVHTNTAIGTPQTRCREMHQSGRVSTMFEIRSSPQAGSHLIFLISFMATLRNVRSPIGVSIPINHCSVVLKMTG